MMLNRQFVFPLAAPFHLYSSTLDIIILQLFFFFHFMGKPGILLFNVPFMHECLGWVSFYFWPLEFCLSPRVLAYFFWLRIKTSIWTPTVSPQATSVVISACDSQCLRCSVASQPPAHSDHIWELAGTNPGVHTVEGIEACWDGGTCCGQIPKPWPFCTMLPQESSRKTI